MPVLWRTGICVSKIGDCKIGDCEKKQGFTGRMLTCRLVNEPWLYNSAIQNTAWPANGTRL